MQTLVRSQALPQSCCPKLPETLGAISKTFTPIPSPSQLFVKTLASALLSIWYHSYCGHCLMKETLVQRPSSSWGHSPEEGGREHCHLHGWCRLPPGWCFTEGTSSAECWYPQLRTALGLLLSPRFQLKMPDMRGPWCTLPNCCFPTRLMRVCFTCPEAAWILLEHCPG